MEYQAPELQNNGYFIGIGKIFVTRAPAVLQTVLGSCVAVVLYDNQKKIGGMIHLVLPQGVGKESEQDPGRFAVSGIPILIQKMINQGAKRKNLLGIVHGGNYTTSCKRCLKDNFRIGEKNVAISAEILKKEKIIFKEFKTLNENASKIFFDLTTGEAKVDIIETRKLCSDCFIGRDN
jgi:chemotaxis protein CheD